MQGIDTSIGHIFGHARKFYLIGKFAPDLQADLSDRAEFDEKDNCIVERGSWAPLTDSSITDHGRQLCLPTALCACYKPREVHPFSKGCAMSDPNPFADFLRRIRAGDQQAAAELVRRYEPLIRREVRLHLEDQRLARLFDSMDVCQSVLASFFLRTAAGEYDLDQPEQLVGLLVRMARNKLASAARRQSRQKRDHRRAVGGGAELDRMPAAGDSPSELVAGQELLQRLQGMLNEEERRLVDLRGQGLAWADVAQRLGGTAQGRRMQLARTLDRIGRELGLDDGAGS